MPSWKAVKAALQSFDRAGLLGLVQDLYGVDKDNKASLTGCGGGREKVAIFFIYGILAEGQMVGDRIMPYLELPDDLDHAPQTRATVPVISTSDDNILARTRRLSRAVTEIYDAKLRPFGISAVQFSLLEIIGRMQPTTRADIARKQELDKSTLTRDLKSIFLDGWIEEVRDGANGRSRPIALTQAGKQLLRDAEPAWLIAQDEVKLLLRKQGFFAE